MYTIIAPSKEKGKVIVYSNESKLQIAIELKNLEGSTTSNITYYVIWTEKRPESYEDTLGAKRVLQVTCRIGQWFIHHFSDDFLESTHIVGGLGQLWNPESVVQPPNG